MRLGSASDVHGKEGEGLIVLRPRAFIGQIYRSRASNKKKLVLVDNHRCLGQNIPIQKLVPDISLRVRYGVAQKEGANSPAGTVNMDSLSHQGRFGKESGGGGVDPT